MARISRLFSRAGHPVDAFAAPVFPSPVGIPLCEMSRKHRDEWFIVENKKKKLLLRACTYARTHAHTLASERARSSRGGGILLKVRWPRSSFLAEAARTFEPSTEKATDGENGIELIFRLFSAFYAHAIWVML